MENKKRLTIDTVIEIYNVSSAVIFIQINK